VRSSEPAGKNVLVREYEIGSEAWARDRIDRGLDPSEGDRPADVRSLGAEAELPVQLGRWAEEYFPRSVFDFQTRPRS
jgi:hypothetical protein